jgi:hypothetical protein
VLVGAGVNALVTGALSGPHDRYQARIAWLLPLAAVLAWPGHGVFRRATQRGATPGDRVSAA